MYTPSLHISGLTNRVKRSKRLTEHDPDREMDSKRDFSNMIVPIICTDVICLKSDMDYEVPSLGPSEHVIQKSIIKCLMLKS